MIADIRGHQLYYEVHEPLIREKGAGDKGLMVSYHPPNPSLLTLVLLHDGLGSTRSWRAQIPALTKAGCRVLAYDRLGYGRSDDRPGFLPPYFEDDQADFWGLVDLLGAERLFLVGHSDGGTLALYLASRRPDRVTGLVVIAAHIYIEASMPPALASLRDQFEASESFRLALRRQHGEKYHRLFYHWINSWSQPQNLAWDMRPQLTQVKCPALVVQGELDEHATPQHARDLAAELPASELWLVPGAGHMFPQENPQLFNDRLVEFIHHCSSLTPGSKGKGISLPPASPHPYSSGDPHV